MSFVPFPRTPHLAWLADTPLRADKLLSPQEADALLAHEVWVEEKVDGANVGFSVAGDRVLVQHRGDYMDGPSVSRYPFLASWVAERQDALVAALGERLVLFGEWCSVVHAIRYDALPDWFLAFDVFDREAGRYWDRERCAALCRDLGLAQVPTVARGRFTIDELVALMGPSRLGAPEMEGVVVRHDADGFLVARAKLVRPGHVQPDAPHWTAGPVRLNALASR